MASPYVKDDQGIYASVTISHLLAHIHVRNLQTK